jgi:hypothetical protein
LLPRQMSHAEELIFVGLVWVNVSRILIRSFFDNIYGYFLRSGIRLLFPHMKQVITMWDSRFDWNRTRHVRAGRK